MKIRTALILCLFVPLQTPAVDLEKAPNEDIGAVDHAAEGSAKSKIRTIKLPEIEESPRLDGILDDVIWQNATALNINTELYPERFAEAIVKTDVLAATTATHLYLGITAYDPEPKRMHSSTRLRDAVRDGDYVSIVIDPTGNLRRKFEFRVNPHGSISDVLQNAVSNRYIYDWDSRWESAAQITDTGWVVEMEIPLDSLKQPTVEEGENPRWLVLLKRNYPRAVDRVFGSVYIFEKELGQLQSEHKKRLELSPYYIFHPDESRTSKKRFEQIKDHDNHELGTDLKLVLDSATAVSVTINPNYTDIEADIARESINNPFTPFQPEKRAFFQEGMDLYSTLMPAVYTRNIVQPKYGLNFTHIGRKISSGGMWVRDEATELVMPDNLGSEQLTIDEMPGDLLTARYVTGEKGSSTGLMLTARTADNYSNYVLGVDGLVNLGLDDKIRYQIMYSDTEYPDEFAQDLCNGDDCLSPPPEECALGDCDYNAAVLRANPDRSLRGHGLRLGYKHDSPTGLYWLNYFDYADDFRADFGLDRRTDYRMINAAMGRNWLFQALRRDKGKSRLRAYLVGQHLQSSAGELIENGVDIWGEFRGSYQTVLRAGYRIKERAVNRINQNTLALGDNAPLFDESYWQWYFESVPSTLFGFNLDGRYGNLADAQNLVLGEMLELTPKITMLFEKMRIQLSHTFRNFDQDGSMLYQENFSTLQFTYHPKTNHTFGMLALFDQTDRDTVRSLSEELALERSGSIEATYVYKPGLGLSISVGAKIRQEDNSFLDENYTSDREVYLKIVYDIDDVSHL